MTADAQTTLRDAGLRAHVWRTEACARICTRPETSLCSPGLCTSHVVKLHVNGAEYFKVLHDAQVFRGVSGSMDCAVLKVDVSDMSSTAPVGLANKTILSNLFKEKTHVMPGTACKS